MLARVTTFEGGTPDGIRAAAEEMRSNIPRAAPGRQEQRPDDARRSGRRPDEMIIGLFAGEEDLRASERALEEMNPPDAAGKRSSVDVYEVGAEVRM